MARQKRVHLDATRQGMAVSQALCSWTAVETTADITQVTCQACLHRFRGTAPIRESSGVDHVELATSAKQAYDASLIPRAPAPPVLTAPVWATVCRWKQARCGMCAVCEHESLMARYYDPRDNTPRLKLPEDAPTWPSVHAALVALVEWERHDRSARSATGPILDRIERGDTGDSGGIKPPDALMTWADDVVHVRQALERAYPDDGHYLLTSSECKALLLARTPGVTEGALTTYEVLAQRLGIGVGECKALVSAGRRTVAGELERRGMLGRGRMV